ncbi:MAG: hypothetical protein KBC95_04830 [Candidatus Peribacteraceae bacterium]|nr:hypothetical protein [Candidatus Peribacteraceae bacterium]
MKPTNDGHDNREAKPGQGQGNQGDAARQDGDRGDQSTPDKEKKDDGAQGQKH